MPQFQPNGYSATVDMRLVVGGESFRVAQAGPDSIRLREPRDLPPVGHAVLLITVDNEESTYYVSLPEGSSRDSQFTTLAASTTMPTLNRAGFVGSRFLS